jgi:hypothetical protein
MDDGGELLCRRMDQVLASFPSLAAGIASKPPGPSSSRRRAAVKARKQEGWMVVIPAIDLRGA